MFKSCAAILAIGLLAIVQPLRATDTPEDAQLRDFLRKTARSSPDSTPAPAAPIAKPKPAVKPAPISEPEPAPKIIPAPAAPAKVAPSAAPVDTETDSVPAASSSNSEDLRQVLRKEMTVPAPVPPPATATVVVKPAPATPAAVKPMPAPTVAPVVAPVTVPQVKAGYTPIETPPSSVSASKEERLADLLKLYKADSISPEEYHTRRAAILAGQ